MSDVDEGATWADPRGEMPTWRDRQPPRPSSGFGLARGFRPGDSVGPYEVVGEISRGSMGVVLRGRHREIASREAAIKVIPLELADPDSLARFEREGQALARLDHPNVVRVYDLALLPDGRPFMAMELVEGPNLEELAGQGALPLAKAARILEQVTRGVAHLHERKVIHRDLKLANVLVQPGSGQPLIADFGLAQITDRNTRLTEDGDMLGTPLYMSPEQVQGQLDVDERADVYAIGVMLYRLLTGAFPFYASTPPRLFELILRAPLELPAELSDDACAVLAQALARDREDRYPSATALADDLDALASGSPVSARPVGGLEERIRGWVRAHPLQAAVLPIVTCLVLVSLVGMVVADRYRRDAAREAERDLRVQTARKAQAEALAAVRAAEGKGLLDARALQQLLAGLEAVAPPDQLSEEEGRAFQLARARLLVASARFADARTILGRMSGPDVSLLRGRLEVFAGNGEQALRESAPVGTEQALLAARIELERALAAGRKVASLLEVLAQVRALSDPDDLAKVPDRVRARALLVEGDAMLALDWPAGAASAFARGRALLTAKDMLAPFPVWVETSRRWVPADVAALVGEATARSRLLDGQAAHIAARQAKARVDRYAPDLAVAWKPQISVEQAVWFRAQGEAELQAFVCDRRYRKKGRKQRKTSDPSKSPRLLVAQRAFTLATRSLPPPLVEDGRCRVGLSRVLLEQGLPKDAWALLPHLAQDVERGRYWRVRFAWGLVRIALGKYSQAVKDLIAAVDALALSDLPRLQRVGAQVEVLREGTRAFRAVNQRTPRLVLLKRFARVCDEFPLTIGMRGEVQRRLMYLARALRDEPGIGQAEAGLKRMREAYRELKPLLEEVKVAGRRGGFLDEPQATKAMHRILEASPTAAGSYVDYHLRFLGMKPSGMDPMIVAFELEPHRTLYTMAINYYREDARRQWGVEQYRRLLTYARGGRSLSGLPIRPDPVLRRALAVLCALEMGSPLTSAERAEGLASGRAFFRARPRSRAASLLLGSLLLELGNPAGALLHLRRAHLLEPLLAEERWIRTERLIPLLQARAHARLRDWPRAVAAARKAVQGGVTERHLIKEERLFREVRTQPATLREEFGALLLVQDRARARLKRKRD